MNILAIDPGFDCTGWAVFQATDPPATLNDALSGLQDSGGMVTRSGRKDPERLHFLGMRVRALVHQWSPERVYVEMPTYEGNYGNNRARRRGVNRLYMATGAILTRLEPEHVIQLPAILTPKATRHELLVAAARTISLDLPEGPRGGAREDEWDAIWLGCQALLERGARDLNPEPLFSAPRVSGSR